MLFIREYTYIIIDIREIYKKCTINKLDRVRVRYIGVFKYISARREVLGELIIVFCWYRENLNNRKLI